jgi:hypothetical protein
MSWRMVGWIVFDEYRRLHWSDCGCAEHPGSFCRSKSLTPFTTKPEAETHAARLEQARGYACTAQELTAR